MVSGLAGIQTQVLLALEIFIRKKNSKKKQRGNYNSSCGSFRMSKVSFRRGWRHLWKRRRNKVLGDLEIRRAWPVPPMHLSNHCVQVQGHAPSIPYLFITLPSEVCYAQIWRLWVNNSLSRSVHSIAAQSLVCPYLCVPKAWRSSLLFLVQIFRDRRGPGSSILSRVENLRILSNQT